MLEIVRVRLADGEPISLERALFPAERFPGLLDRSLGGSLYELLETHYGLVPGEAEERIEVVAAGRRRGAAAGAAPRARRCSRSRAPRGTRTAARSSARTTCSAATARGRRACARGARGATLVGAAVQVR